MARKKQPEEKVKKVAGTDNVMGLKAEITEQVPAGGKADA